MTGSDSPPDEARVVVYGKPGCHLCDDVYAIVDQVCADVGASWQAVDIHEDATQRLLGTLVQVATGDDDDRPSVRDQVLVAEDVALPLLGVALVMHPVV